MMMGIDLDRPPAPPPGPPLMRAREVADCYRVDLNHVYIALQKGALPGAFQLPDSNRWRIPRAAVAAHMASTWTGPLL
jgi:hypothetical protein